MNSKLITIIGNVGSGKTTLSEIIAQNFDVKLLRADELFQTGNPFKEDFLSDMRRWSLANELWLVHERVKLMRTHLEKYPEKMSLIDSGILMSWVYTFTHFVTGNLRQHEWDLYQNLYQELIREFPHSLTVIDLQFSYDTLMKRIKKRGRDYEIRQYAHYVKDLEKGLEGLRNKLHKEKIKMIAVNEAEITDFENNKKDRALVINKLKRSILIGK